MDRPDGTSGGTISASSPKSFKYPIVRKMFLNDVELRAGWRFLIAVLLSSVCGLAILTAPRLLHLPVPPRSSELTAPSLIWSEASLFLGLLIAVAILATLEKRRMACYGLALRGAFGKYFWLGTLWGFGALTVLLTILRACHTFYFGKASLHGREIASYALLWGVAFLFVGLLEEYKYRGYGQFTLTTGVGFWPAALLLSSWFAISHRENEGENWIGLLEVAAFGLFWAFTLRRTGTLWFAVGCHAAWDWGETFFYGTPDSGYLARGHLLNSSVQGPAWLSGGSVGPEGSLLSILLLLVLAILFHFCFPSESKYPLAECAKSPVPAADHSAVPQAQPSQGEF
jgi:membrane protease YdiL (CAAX protease family)